MDWEHKVGQVVDSVVKKTVFYFFVFYQNKKPFFSVFFRFLFVLFVFFVFYFIFLIFIELIVSFDLKSLLCINLNI